MRELQGNDIVFMHPVSPTGALSQLEVAISLDELAAFVLKQMQPAPVAEAIAEPVPVSEPDPEPEVTPEPPQPDPAQEVVP